ncbi:MAG: carotenoid oxygenase family protein [Gammaproteobacteria bacterium]
MPASSPAGVMPAPFGDGHGPFLCGPYAPVDGEIEAAPRIRTGALPTDLNGVYLRVGPNPRFAPLGRYHPFDGDGLIHAAHFERGAVVYRRRWVRTTDFATEDGAGQAVFHGIRETLAGSRARPLKDSANTDVLGFAGQALALWYMAGAAHVVDPITLETRGTLTAITAARGGRGRISAHAKVDPVSGELLYFDYGTEAPWMHYGVVAPDGRLVHHTPITLPGPRLPHDMAFTEHYSLLHDLPLFHDADALALGRHKIAFHADVPTRFGVLPRYGRDADLRWFEFTPCFVYHVVNAWEDGAEIVMVGCRYQPVIDVDGRIDAAATAQQVAALAMNARLWCWRMDLGTGASREYPLDAERNVEFPSCNAQLAGRPTRYGYLADQHDTAILRWPGLAKYDLVSGTRLSSWSSDAEHSWYSEPWFAPADDARAEDDGYLVAFRLDDRDLSSTLEVFDARDLARGPLAVLDLPERVPVGFHACWIRTADIAPPS